MRARENGENELTIDAQKAWVQWIIVDAKFRDTVKTPWAELWLGAERGGGLEVWVEARQAFTLTLIWDETSFFEHITPGRWQLLLTVLDRTEVLRVDHPGPDSQYQSSSKT